MLLPLAAALSLGGCLAPASGGSDAPAPRAIKVVTWNLEHLAERNGEGCRPRSDADYAALRAHAVALGADVIAFQEVESRAAAERVFDPASYDVVMSARPQTRRGGSCYGAPGQQIGHQGVGFAVRKGLRWTRNADFAALALGNPDLRWGVDITIEGRRPLRLLGVHLKSGCNSGNAPTDPDCPVLFGQLPVLERWIDARAGEGSAFAVLGDWNRRIASRGDAFYAEIDDGDPVGADLNIAGDGRVATCKARYREFIDHIVTGAVATGLVEPGSFDEYRYGLPEAQHPSDHCPVSVMFRL